MSLGATTVPDNSDVSMEDAWDLHSIRPSLSPAPDDIEFDNKAPVEMVRDFTHCVTYQLTLSRRSI